MKLTPTQTADVLTRFDDSKRAVANLMARENIAVQIVDGAETASFDPASRILTIPNWSTLSLDQVDLLMAHEIGHALFSTADIYEKIAKDKKSLFGYVNIVEDARIERKMKNAFPGLARVFYNGYHQFTTDGPIFKIIDRDHMLNTRTGLPTAIASMKLIDRINLYFKIGAFVNVPFAENERQWIDKIDKCGSMDQGIEIARQLHKLAKETEKPESKPQPQKNEEQSKSKQQAPPSDEQEESDESGDDADGNDSSDDSKDEESNDDSGDDQSDSDKSTDGDDQDDQDGDTDSTEQSDDESDESADDDSTDGDDQDGDDESDESGEKSGDDAAKDGDEGDEQGDKPSQSDSDADDVDAPETGDTDDLLKKCANKPKADARIEIRHLILSPLDAQTVKGRTVPASDWAAAAMVEMKKHDTNIDAQLDILSQEWDARLMSTASHMALEFERRKTAKQYQNARVAKTGRLNLTKLSQYKFTDDMFLRSMTLPNGKSHGVVMIIDGSGSMSGCFANVIDQVLLFAHFAQKVNIPFEAYMFTSQSATSSRYSDPLPEHKPGFNAIALDAQGSIVGLINTKSDRASFKRQVRVCLAMRQQFANDCPSMTYESRYAFSAIPYVHLGSTPLFSGILLAEAALDRMKKQNRLDKTTFIVVSDGEDTNSLRFETVGINRYNGTTESKWVDIESAGLVVRDTVTKRNFVQVETWVDYDGAQSHRCPQNGALTMLLDVVKARHGSRTVYLYLQSSGYGYNPYSRYRRRRRSVAVTCDGFNSMVRAGKLEASNAIAMDTVTADLKANGQYVLPTELAVADLAVILRTSVLELTEDEFAKLDTEDMTQRKIAQAFTKSMTKAVANRVFVNTVIPHLI